MLFILTTLRTEKDFKERLIKIFFKQKDTRRFLVYYCCWFHINIKYGFRYRRIFHLIFQEESESSNEESNSCGMSSFSDDTSKAEL